MRTIEVVGCNPKSAGDVLMLEAVVRELGRRMPDAAFCVRSRRSLARATPGLPLKWLPAVRVSRRRARFDMLLDRWCAAPIAVLAAPATGWASPWRVSGVVDVCGYKYGGLWGRGAIDLDSRVYAEARARGQSVVLMPKTYGPFEDDSTRRAMVRLAHQVELSLTRDGISQRHLVGLGVDPSRCSVFPDYTSAVPGSSLRPNQRGFPKVIVIPNTRMVDAAGPLSDASYQDVIRDVLDLARAAGMSAALMAHDSGQDIVLCQRLSREFKVPVIHERVATVAKSIIGQAEVVYSDRLHGLIGALSQGVPAMTMGWSHKYRETLTDYGVPDFQVSRDRDSGRHVAQIWDLLWQSRSLWRDRLLEVRVQIESRLSPMWDRIAGVLQR